MKMFQFFRGTKQDNEAVHKALNAICDKISLKTGVDRFIIKENYAILSGDETEHSMLLELSQVKTKGKLNLYANLFLSEINGTADETSWHEWDFEDFETFSNAVADYIFPLINRTVKFKTEWKRKESITCTISVLNESSGEWETILTETVDDKIIAIWIKHDKIEENICVFKI